MKKYLKFLLGIIFSLLLMFFLYRDIPFDFLSDFYEKINFQIIAVSFFIYLLMNLFRALRVKLIFPKISFFKTLSITFIHNFMNSILPFRSGELSYIYMIRKEKDTHHAISSFFMIRVMDFLSAFLILSISFLFVEKTELLNKLFFYTTIVVLIIIIVLFLFRNTKFMNLKIIRRTKELVKNYSIKDMIKVLLPSIAVWILSTLFFYSIIYHLGLGLSFFEVSVSSVFNFFMSVLPVNGFAGIGVVELSWNLGLSLFSIDSNTAITTGLIINIVRIFSFSVLGLAGFIMRLIKKN